MESKVVTYENLSVTVTRASARMGMKRTLMQQDAVTEQNALLSAHLKENPDYIFTLDDRADRLLRTVFYPSMICATIAHSGFESWPPSFAEYEELPEQFLIMWEEAVFSLNEHWKPQPPPSKQEQEEAEKKA